MWARAWLLLDVDAKGRVTKVTFLKKAGHDLDEIAVREARKLRFTPARDDAGRPVASRVVIPMEWPSYWWLVNMDEPPNRVPPRAENVPCAGSGPLRFESLHPTFRDCSLPDLNKIATEPWVTQ